MRVKEVITYEELRRRNRIATKKWRESHRDRYRELAKRYYETHREEILERNARRRWANGVIPRMLKPKPVTHPKNVDEIFKNPMVASHVKWLADNRNKQLIQQEL